ncbi:unnamed protein product [Meloidogyne enterolobii]|uniref:Uncharacterized protein n=1 Tax=Meloidogyne enterolobii TaxID=390850 RepID=A0ACB0XXI7_MELEN
MRNIKKIKFLILSKILILFFCFVYQTNAGTTSKRKEREPSNLISFQTAKKQKTGKSTKNVYTITVEQQLGLLNECKSLKPYEFQYLLKIYVGKINSNEGHKITEGREFNL